MNLPNPQELFKQIELKIHNGVFRCVSCEEMFNLKTEKIKVVMRILGVAPVNAGQPQRPDAQMNLAPLYEYSPICQECFDELGLSEDEPKIVVPKYVPPADVSAALKKN